MNLLLVEDEPGIREGLATFLRFNGHVVHVADSSAAGGRAAARGAFDLVVTDWRLGDGTGEHVLQDCRCPAIVMTGSPQEVTTAREGDVVLKKPVSPTRLLDEVGRHVPSDDPVPATSWEERLAALPQDARDRARLAWALTGRPSGADLRDDGDCIVVHLPAAGVSSQTNSRLSRLGGDLQILGTEGDRGVELRLYRNGRPRGVEVVAWGEPWPTSTEQPIAVDLHGAGCSPSAFVELLERVRAEQHRGRTVHLLNIPRHLRRHIAGLGRLHLLPNRPKSGPDLPEVLEELWRHG